MSKYNVGNDVKEIYMRKPSKLLESVKNVFIDVAYGLSIGALTIGILYGVDKEVNYQQRQEALFMQKNNISLTQETSRIEVSADLY